jgi:hypothetical protein
MTTTYTADSVKSSLAPKYEGYYAKLALGHPDEDRLFCQNYFNRKARAEYDLYALAAKAVNSFLTGTIERFRRR